MKPTFTQTIIISFLFLFFGCSPKQTFYLNKGAGSFEPYKQKRSLVLEKPLITSSSELWGGAVKIVTDSILFWASVEADHNSYNMPDLKKELPIPPNTAESRIAIKSLVPKQLRQLKTMQKVVYKRFVPKPEVVKPIHKQAKLGLGLSVAGIGLFLILAIVPSVPIIGLLASLSAKVGTLISIIALRNIKSKPEVYSGKGKALAGIIIGIIGIAISILYLWTIAITLISAMAFLGI